MYRAANSDSNVLAWLLSPIPTDEFLSEYFDRKPLHVARRTPVYYQNVFSLTEFERALAGSTLRTRDLQIFRDGTAVRTELYTVPVKRRSPMDDAVGIIDPDRAAGLFASGCTLTMASIDLWSSSFAACNRALENAMGCGINANAYLTPRNNQGFAVHYDSHDTLIIQIQGKKKWRVFEPVLPLPLDHQGYDSKVHKPVGDPILEMELCAGDLLYLPRGYLHEARANEELSLHVTFGFFPPRWAQVLSATVQRIAEQNVNLRHYATAEGARALQPLLAEVFSPSNLGTTITDLQNAFLADRRNDVSGQLHQIDALSALNEESIVSKRPHLLYRAESFELGVKLHFSGKTVNLPVGAKAIITELERTPAVKVRSLLRFDEEALRIVHRLIESGFAVAHLEAAQPAVVT